jgi:hypothetical protein
VPACVLAGAAGVIVQVSALVTQHSGLPSIARLAIGLSATAGLLVLLAKSFPELCLGRDGVWMIHQLQARFPSLRNLKVAADLT